MNKKLIVRLKSDLCVGTGESLGSLIDTDICYDNYGLPYIPSKRLKGLLREAFIEYSEWSETKEEYDKLQEIGKKLFGTEGANNSCNLKIDNAYIEEYEKIINDINNVEDTYKKYLSKQRVINSNTSIRYQTAVDLETGVAKENSLRSMRVLDKGIKFLSNIECETEEEMNLLKPIVQLVNHIGTHRTRGFGEVICMLQDDEMNIKENEDIELLNDVKYKIDLLLEANSNIMVSKKQSEISEDYIPGSNIMGAIANQYIKDNNINDFSNISDDFINLFLNGTVKYSNAYITEKNGEVEYYPAPLSYTKVKNTKNKYHNKMFDVNEENIQLSNLSNKYVSLDCNNYIKEVNLKEHYHHQRAKDLSIGHVSISEDGGTLYQFTSIDMNQYFLAHIEGKGKYIKNILKYINKNNVLRVGKSRTAEYGKLIIKDRKINELNEKYNTYNNFAVILTSPVILFDEENVKIANDKETLINKLKEVLSLENAKITKAFIGYSDESGYNAIWNLPKEQVSSYEKGTTICFETEQSVNLKEEYTIGVRQNEGYGNIKIFNIDKNSNSNIELKKYFDENNEKIEYKILQKETRKIINKSIKNVLIEEIKEDVLKQIGHNNIKLNNTTIGRILLMLQESQSLDTFMNNVKAIKDDKKLNKIINIIENKENLKSLQAYKDLDNIFKLANSKIPDEDVEKYTLEYIKQFFSVLKIMGGESND